MNTSEHINEIAAALAKAQGEMENAAKNAQNPHFKNRYADLAEVLNAVRPVLSKNGIAVFQASSVDGNVMVLHTRLLHTSGQWLESVHPVCSLPAKPQEIGACETYARRYSLAAICGIAQEDDDLADGKATRPVAAPAAAPIEKPKGLSNADSKKLLEVMQDTLAMCESPDSVRAWAKANQAAKAQLMPEHQDMISAMYRDRLADVSQPIAAE